MSPTTTYCRGKIPDVIRLYEVAGNPTSDPPSTEISLLQLANPLVETFIVCFPSDSLRTAGAFSRHGHRLGNRQQQRRIRLPQHLSVAVRLAIYNEDL
jgi:hypothetical protein